jgi:hypothetical protein
METSKVGIEMFAGLSCDKHLNHSQYQVGMHMSEVAVRISLLKMMLILAEELWLQTLTLERID